MAGQLLPYFPRPEDGETVFSTVARCSTRMGIARKHLLSLLTGKETKAGLFSALPSRLTAISQSIPLGHPWRDPRRIVEGHTNLPYYTFFDAEEFHRATRDSLIDADIANRVSMGLGLTQYRCGAAAQNPRFCLECVRVDDHECGFPYFHREHQLPGVALCWKHDRPLQHGCRVCGPYPLRNDPFVLPGRCHCEHLSPLPAFNSLPTQGDALAWLARESAAMVSIAGGQQAGASAKLKQALIDLGYSRGNLLLYREVASALVKRYGVDFLNWLHYSALEEHRPAAWIRRHFFVSDERSKRKAALAHLLLLGLGFASVSDFRAGIRGHQKESTQSPSDRSCNEVVVESGANQGEDWRQGLEERIRSCNYRISSLASATGVGLDTLTRELRDQSIRVPLTVRATDRIGRQNLEAIRIDLRVGRDKAEIMNARRVSEWTLRLIELDQPGLATIHKLAAAGHVLQKHRRELDKFLASNPGASRSDIFREMSGSYDFFRSKDSNWFDARILTLRKTATSSRPNRLDWDAWDKKTAESIRRTASAENTASKRPRQLTRTALLRAASALARYHSASRTHPLTDAALQECAETDEQFAARKILWGIKELARDGRELSVNSLRRKVGMPAQKLRARRELALSAIRDIGAKVASRSFFS